MIRQNYDDADIDINDDDDGDGDNGDDDENHEEEDGGNADIGKRVSSVTFSVTIAMKTTITKMRR